MTKKYLVCNACYEDGELNLYTPMVYDDFASAKLFCQVNIMEDFGCNTYEELEKLYSPTECFYDSDLLYMISCDNYGGHEEIYKIFVIEV